ncbi:MAG TPA: histidine kinase [Candidatus Eisenbergiella merdipullorum]|uniref:Histidine kinase n=1 Tax=Candidatus Eisenbergiella merdipullorum TaxID=2838553 RepID=A0A9D2I9P4_9FIRM|nr:histidine kinase [Candidatus Eisenbergiella merdipullorum]
MSSWLLNLKLKKKAILLILVMVFGLFLAETLNRQNAYGEYRLQIFEKDVQILNIYGNYIDTVFDKIEGIAYSIVGDQELQEDLVCIRDSSKTSEYYSSLKDANDLLRAYFRQEPYFSSMVLYMDSYLFKYGNLNVDIEDELEGYIDATEGKNGRTQMISEEGKIVLVKEIRQSIGYEISHLGYIIAWVDFSAIMEDVKSEFPGEPVDFRLSIYDGDICLYSNTSYPEYFQREEDGWYIDQDDLVTVHTSPALGYTMVIRTFYGDIQKQIRQVYINSFLISLLVSAAAVLLSDLAINYVIRDLDNLVQKMDDFGMGKLLDQGGEQKYRSRGDEIGKLYRHFYRMTSDYKKLMDKYYKSKILLKEMEFSYLQKQIQPHFLYNTLSAISWMAFANQDTETANMVEILGRMMRMITDAQEPMISVERDLQIVEDYVKIQKLRFGNRLNVEIKISEMTKSLLIPKITLQPLVENSIIHGLDKMISRCEIKIYERKEEDITEIIVEDNGPGFGEDILERLGLENREEKDQIAEEGKSLSETSGERDSGGSGVALRNIHIRLQYAFSEKYGLVFRHLEDGMQVVVRIPNNQ